MNPKSSEKKNGRAGTKNALKRKMVGPEPKKL